MNPELPAGPAQADALSYDRAGNLCLSDVPGGAYKFDGRQFVALAVPDLATNNFDAFVDDGEGKQWIILNNRTLAREVNGAYETFSDPEGEAGTYVRAAIPCRQRGLWITNGRSLRRWTGDGWTGVRWNYSSERTSVFAMCEDGRGDVWLATFGHGLFRCEPGGAIRCYGATNQLSHDVIRSVMEDVEGNIWAGTDGGGLNHFKRLFFSSLGSRQGLGGNIVMSVCQDAVGRIWLASNGGGLNVWDGELMQRIMHGAAATNRYIWSVCADPAGDIWFGTWGNGLLRYRPRTHECQPAPAGLLNDKPLVLFSDRAGNLWAGGPNGVDCLRGDRRLRSFTVREGLPHNDVRALAEDSPGGLFIGTEGGLGSLREGKMRTLALDSRLSRQIRGLYVDATDRLWVGSAGGLSRLSDGRFFAFGVRHGFLEGSIGSITEDASGYLWMMADRGIVRASRRELEAVAEGKGSKVTAIIYGKSEGLPSEESSGNGRVQPVLCRAADGRLWIPTVNGAAVVDPGQVTVNDRVPAVVVEEVLVDGQNVLSSRKAATASGNGERIRVVPGSERLEIYYTALSLTAPEKVRFRYRLEGLERDWVDAGTRRVAYYSRLEPGEYRFRVMGCNNDSIWNETGAQLGVSALPFVWQTWWFRTMGIVLGAAAGAWWLRYLAVRRLKRRLTELEHRHAVERERSRIAQDMHDHLGASLTKITLLSELDQREASKRGDTDRLRKISSTSRELAQIIDEIVWAVDPTKDSLDALANYLASFTAELFQVTRIHCRLDMPPFLPVVPVPADQRHNILLVVKEALNNVIKHSYASEVWVRLRFEPPALTITIEDNGRGFDPSATAEGSAGNGLRNMRNRMRQIGGTLELTSQAGAGTRLVLMVSVVATK